LEFKLPADERKKGKEKRELGGRKREGKKRERYHDGIERSLTPLP